MVGNVGPSLSRDVPARALETGSKEHARARSECADTSRALAACPWQRCGRVAVELGYLYELQAVHHPAADPASCSSSSGCLSIDRAIQRYKKQASKSGGCDMIADFRCSRPCIAKPLRTTPHLTPHHPSSRQNTFVLALRQRNVFVVSVYDPLSRVFNQ